MKSTHQIFVNGRALGRRITGVERCTVEVLRRLEGQVTLIRPHRAASGFAGHVWEQFVLPAQLPGGALLWSPANAGPLVVERQVVTIHDLSPIEHPEWFRPAFARLHRFLLPGLVGRARGLIVPSQNVRERLVRMFPEAAGKVRVVPEGVDGDHFYLRSSGEVERLRQRYGLPSLFFLSVGSLQPRKNLPVLLEAWEHVRRHRPDLALVVAGAGGPAFPPLPDIGAAPGVHFPGYVPDYDLPALYSAALGFILVSQDEGFGLTVLEAMSCSRPVVAARAGALPDLVEDAALLVDPDSVGEIAAAVDALAGDPVLRHCLARKAARRARVFTWEHSARMCLRLLRELA